MWPPSNVSAKTLHQTTRWSCKNGHSRHRYRYFISYSIGIWSVDGKIWGHVQNPSVANVFTLPKLGRVHYWVGPNRHQKWSSPDPRCWWKMTPLSAQGTGTRKLCYIVWHKGNNPPAVEQQIKEWWVHALSDLSLVTYFDTVFFLYDRKGT